MSSFDNHKLGLIVPYRDRAEHIRQFLPYMLSYLAKQGVDATIYVVEQEDGTAFNRAKLLNIDIEQLSSIKGCSILLLNNIDRSVNALLGEIAQHIRQELSDVLCPVTIRNDEPQFMIVKTTHLLLSPTFKH